MKTPTLAPVLTARRLAAATLALALAGGAVLATPHAQAAPGGGHEAGMGGMGGMPGMPMLGAPRHLERLLDDVGASADQKSQIKSILEAARTDLKAQHEAGRTLMQQQMDLFTQPTVDARAAEALRQQMLTRHDQASKRMLQAMLDVSRVLTPEQRQKLAARMNERRAMMERRMRDGSGPASRPSN